jgi:hypothetical protein
MITWTATGNPTLNNKEWVCVASNSTGQYLVALVLGGDIYRSSDYGTNWSVINTGGQKSWISSALDSTGQYLVAVVFGGDIYTSSNYGTTLTATGNSSLNHLLWTSSASDSTGQYLLAVSQYVNASGGHIYRSSDYGTNWSVLNTGGQKFWRSVASDSTGQYLVAAVLGGDIYTSSNYGTTWTATGNPSLNWHKVVSNSTGQYLAAMYDTIVTGYATGYIYTSSDYGATWMPNSNPSFNKIWKSIASDYTGQYLAADVSGGDIYTSSDYGATWMPTSNPSLNTLNWWDIASNSDGTKLVAIVSSGDIYLGNRNSGGGGGGGGGGSQAPCFKKHTKILTNKGYLPIQDLRNGDLVKTLRHGYKPIRYIGKMDIYNPGNYDRTKNRLYLCSKDKYHDLIEDLIITGCHSILVDHLTEDQIAKIQNLSGEVFETDLNYRLPTMIDERSIPYEKEGTFTIYHFALENDDVYMNYGVYANGLLVETCPIIHLKDGSRMELIE